MLAKHQMTIKSSQHNKFVHTADVMCPNHHSPCLTRVMPAAATQALQGTVPFMHVACKMQNNAWCSDDRGQPKKERYENCLVAMA
jgi:hypothetical protein